MRVLLSVIAVATVYCSFADNNVIAEEVIKETTKVQGQTNRTVANTMKSADIVTIPADENNIANNNIMGLPASDASQTKQDVITGNFHDQESQMQKENNNKLTYQQINDFRTEIRGYDEVYSKNVKVGFINTGINNKKIDIRVKSAKDSKEGVSSMEIRKAYDCFVNKQYELAVMYYKKALKNNRRNNDAKFGLATTYYMLMQYDQAIEIYSDLIINHYAREKVVNNLLFALQHKAYKDALNVLLYINDNSKGYSDILAQIGLIYMHLGDINKALSALNRANELAPSNALISYNLGIVYDKQNNYDYAKHFYEQAVRNDISDIISSKDFKNLSNRIEQLNEIIKKEVDKLVKSSKKD